MNTYIVKIDFNYVDDEGTIKDQVSREYLIETENNATCALEIAVGHMKNNETNLLTINLIRDIVNVESHKIRWIEWYQKDSLYKIKRIL